MLRGKILGGGVSANVYEYADARTGEKYALKVFDNYLDDYDNEVNIMGHLPPHKNLLTPISHPAVKNGELLLPLMGGSCVDIDYDEPEAKYIIKEIFSGIAAIHAAGIIHCDIKPDNILWGLDNSVKIADFGGSAFINNPPSTYSIGTLEYNPPEALLGVEYDKTVDIWAGLTTAFYILSGRDLFECCSCEDESSEEEAGEEAEEEASEDDYEDDLEDEYEILKMIEYGIEPLPHFLKKKGRIHYTYNGNLKYDPLYESLDLFCGIDEAAAEFFRWGLRTNPSDRPSADEVLSHPWLSNVDERDIRIVY